VTMEIAQAYDATRDTGPLDVLTNTTGAAAGALAALLFRPSLESLIHRGTRRTAAAATVLAVVWASFQLYPFIPLIGYYRLLAGLALLAASPGMAPLECWTAAAEWFAIWLLIDTLELPKRRLAMAAVLLALPLRLFIPGRAVHWSDVLGAALAVILWRLSPSRWRLRLGVWMVASAILLRELAPFHFAESAAPFMWMPFSQTVANHRDGLMVILLGKAFDYGAAVWAFHAAGWSYRRAGGLLAAVLLVLEQVQRYLPGRTPETTDPVLALVMALALWLASDFHPRRR